ncbi:photosynthetic complex putative assembly protein PuhB [Hydrogenophaga crocea]|uniref:PH domain-containing protein n=1 Tax=Hydrogenophaga crocea TaxID=2716225 RepID=A0A6G8IC35_9BURK|nr:photosynthetic complex putative assembly protein PuhB [Hydrogenophaga crocea]QIM50628.1 PH domain-containing protein [Hydrogenophaga crocea]
MSHRHTPPGQHEHDFEAAHGLPEALPAGERLLWQGAPDWRALAWHVFHVREVLVYFALLLGWRALDVGLAGGGPGQALLALLWLTPLAALALGLLGVLAWLSARTAVYTVTTRRTVMRVGIVLSVTFNLPHRQVDGVALRPRANGRGDLALQLAPGERIGWLHLWPHARPWRVRRPEPALRCIPDAARVGALLSQALAERPLAPLAAAPAAVARPAARPDTALA